jgi:hypothetical protein
MVQTFSQTLFEKKCIPSKNEVFYSTYHVNDYKIKIIIIILFILIIVFFSFTSDGTQDYVFDHLVRHSASDGFCCFSDIRKYNYTILYNIYLIFIHLNMRTRRLNIIKNISLSEEKKPMHHRGISFEY